MNMIDDMKLIGRVA